MYKSRRIVVRNENRSRRGEGSEKWRVKSEKWAEVSEQGSVNINHWTLIIEHWYWHEVFCVCCRDDLQIALCCCVRFFLKFARIANSPMFSIAPPCGRANYNSPLRVCYLDVRKYRCKYTCKYTEKHHGHGVSMFAHVVGAICKSPLCCCVRFFLESLTLQICPCYKFTHITIRPCFQLPPHVEGLIAISPYTCVFLNVRKYVNTCKYTKNIMGMVWVCLRVS